MQIFLKMASEKGGVPKKGENSEKGGKSAETDASEDWDIYIPASPI